MIFDNALQKKFIADMAIMEKTQSGADKNFIIGP